MPFWLTDVAGRAPVDFRTLAACIVVGVPESRVIKLLTGFTGHVCENTLPYQRLTERVFSPVTGLLKPSESSLYLLSVRTVFIKAVLQCTEHLKNKGTNKLNP